MVVARHDSNQRGELTGTPGAVRSKSDMGIPAGRPSHSTSRKAERCLIVGRYESVRCAAAVTCLTVPPAEAATATFKSVGAASSRRPVGDPPVKRPER